MDFQWMNESSIQQDGNTLGIWAPAQADFFNHHEGMCVATAPYIYTEITGDFVTRARVSLDFVDTYDSCVIMLMKDLSTWAKACLELTDYGQPSVVSVVTNGPSDDANGCAVDSNEVWLQAARKGDSYAFHYSMDGEKWYMMRFFSIPMGETIKVGLAAQAPVGNGGMRYFKDFVIEQRSVENLRAGK